MVRWNITYHLSKFRHAIPGIRFISLEPTTRIRLKNIRKCTAKINPLKRIMPATLWKKTRKRQFYTNLQDCARYREGKLVRWKQSQGNEPRTHFLLDRMATLWNNLPKDIAFAHSVSSFKSKLDFWLEQIRQIHAHLLIKDGYLVTLIILVYP